MHTGGFEGIVASNFEGYVTKFAPHQALHLIIWCNLTFDEIVSLHRVESFWFQGNEGFAIFQIRTFLVRSGEGRTAATRQRTTRPRWVVGVMSPYLPPVKDILDSQAHVRQSNSR